jgi:Lon protease-like protein
MAPPTASLLNCSVCDHQLVEPVTLSCGFTVCLKCLPSKAAFQRSTFVCPVSQCKRESHLFGPSLFLNDTIRNVITQDIIQNDEQVDETLYNNASNILQCSLGGNHLLSNPITNHCGHTFCRICLLQFKISNEQCIKCPNRLPSYQFIQQQPLNLLLDNLLKIFNHPQPYNSAGLTPNHQKPSISFLDLNQISYKNIPIYLSDFAVLPSQKLRIPIYTEQHRTILLNSLLPCKEYQCLCLGILSKDKTKKKGHFGTMVKITAIEQRSNDTLIDVTGMDRFQVISVNQETEDFILVDLEMKFEDQQDLQDVMTKKKHWTERQEATRPPLALPKESYTDVVMGNNTTINNITTVVPPLLPPHSAESLEAINKSEPISSAVQLSSRVHDFIRELAHSTPSKAFCSALEGLLGPVWLQSVQGLHGPLPSGDNPVAMCWWAAVVLPVSNTDRYQLLETLPLTGRLNIILSWIHDLKSQ